MNTSEQTNLAQLIIRAFYWMDEGLQQNLRKSGGPEVSHAQSMVILCVGEGFRRPSQIADRLGVSRQAVHQSLRELVGHGLVELVPDELDKRAKVVKLSKTGMPKHLVAADILVELEAALAARIGKRHVKQLRDALEADWGEPVQLSVRKGAA
jgi:DNA-binding MarR family transcriptional regulator